VFFVVGALVWGLAHAYVARSLLRPLKLSKRRVRWAVVAVVGLWALAPLVFAGGRLVGDQAWFRFVAWGMYGYMGLFATVLPLVLLRDLLIVPFDVGRRLRRRSGSKDASPTDPERRRFLLNATNTGIVAVTATSSGVGVVQAHATPTVVRTRLPIDGLPPELEGYRIAQISDLHVGPTIRGGDLQAILSPDLVAVTGDLVDGYVAELGPEVAPLSRLSAPDGVFFVTGNHEYYWGALEWCAEVERLGLTVLNNAHRVVERGEARLLVAGATDFRAGTRLPEHESDPVGARQGAPPCDLSLLLAHQPRSVYDAVKAGYDLMLCGHTHGGQFYPWAAFVGIAHPITAGLGRFEQTWVYVNRGTGYWGPPLRTGVPMEITLIELTRGS
jgi:predicted MPP superfamily phosphohydrolase/uncharacterized membrane protein